MCSVILSKICWIVILNGITPSNNPPTRELNTEKDRFYYERQRCELEKLGVDENLSNNTWGSTKKMVGFMKSILGFCQENIGNEEQRISFQQERGRGFVNWDWTVTEKKERLGMRVHAKLRQVDIPSTQSHGSNRKVQHQPASIHHSSGISTLVFLMSAS